ncbi:MAG: phosphotransferase [Chitinophagia bacterium]|jgi:aminoglycoside/choline kinase family phosphotransferase
MEAIKEAIKQIYLSYTGKACEHIEKIPQSGGDRIYFRIKEGAESYIATYNLNLKENETFIYFAQHFHSKGLPVPKVLAVSADQKIYLQEDLGSESLLDVLEKEGKTERVYQLFQKSLKALVQLQVKGSEGLDYSKCLTSKTFGKHAVLTDLLYYKYYFLDTLQYPYDKQALIDEFELLSDQLSDSHFNYFLFRDFQSRNIIVKNDEVFFIDFQGGMKGGMPYDVASLLWQAKAELSNEWKERLLNDYIKEAEQVLSETIDATLFKKQYHGFVLLRLLQVLGAYGFRGLFERKAHFLTSIPLGLRNLKSFLEVYTLDKDTPVFAGILKWMVGDDVLKRFTPTQATEKTPLVITINSFSYKNGLPSDASENGGGFIFDMRGILNPGRFDDYKKLSGLDKPVQDFLEQKTKMNTFLNSVWDLIDITVENYLSRDFESLQINFGCTGGQHRSVFAAEQTARHLKNKYKVKVVLVHTNQANWIK